MAARYQAADAREHVGGDWYDAAPVPDPAHPGDLVLAVSVGDIIGHTLLATTIMGQVRSMLRQAAWDHPGTPPSATLDAFELANTGLDLHATGTAVLAHLRRSAPDRWSMRWSNAGHPPPILVGPDGDATLLTEHDSLFGFPGVQPGARADSEITIESGSLLLLYSDGLVERRGSDLDAGTEALVRLLCQIRDRPVQELVDIVMSSLGSDSGDDVVAFVIRFPD